MGPLLAVHLGVVMTPFLMLPRGKFAHGIFCGATLLEWQTKKRKPTRLTIGEELF